ncbi:ARM repeat-containing protein [Rickenella mellea]|uniref:MMS19 nucleotide excision repair protein n=1 Tax=Rickenella mellea TaxID=50990 RepID=A0A4Y7Q911_9AGAM|nr:ARM repeat-containing protein [Rickenella mellea]
MESTQRLVQTWMGSGRDAEIDQIVTGFSGGQTSLLNIVQALGEYLTSEEDVLRTKGVQLLGTVIRRCPPDKINRQATRVLLTFFTSKLDDTETIIPALNALVSLTTLPNFISADATETMNALFKHVNMKAHVQSTRHHVFAIVDSLMARHRDALKNMGDSFLRGYITLADGEKDPRNLLLAFSIARVIAIEFDITNHVDSLFDITFCYFPITFRPPPDDPYGITAEDLKQSLRLCLSATPLIGRMAVIQFLEKLTAGNPVTKRDTLETLSICLPVYGPGVAQEFSRKLWNLLKLEILQPTDPDTEQKALDTTQVLINTIYSSEVADTGESYDVEGLAKEICEECLEVLREPEKSQAKPAIKVLGALAGTRPSVSRYTLSQAIPYLTNLFKSLDELLNRPQVLLLLGDLLEIVYKLPTSPRKDGEPEGTLLLSPFKDDILGVLLAGLKATETVGPALLGLKKLSQMKGLLEDDEFTIVVRNINDVLQSDADDEDTGEVVLDALVTISSIAPKHIEEGTLPLLFLSLPDRTPARDAHTERAKIWRTLSSLTKLCIPPSLFETLVVRLSTKLELICAPRNQTDIVDVEAASAYAHSILKALATTLDVKITSKHVDVAKYIDRLLPRLYHLFFYVASVYEPSHMVTANHRVLEVAGQIITLVVQVNPIERQQVFAKALEAAYHSGDPKALSQGIQEIPMDVKFQPFGIPSQRDLTALYSAAVIAFHNGVTTFGDPTDPQGLTKVVLDDEYTPFQRDSACSSMAALLNKHLDGQPETFLSQRKIFWDTEIADVKQPFNRRRNALEGWVWITKALVIRSHPFVEWMVNSLFEIFDDENLAWDAAKAVGRVASGEDGILTKRNHAVIRILHAQKYVIAVLPKVIDGLKSSTPPRQTVYRIALISLITSVPKQTYIGQMETLMSHLLRGLDVPDMDMRTDLINALLAIAESMEQREPITTHASSIIAAMLRSCKFSEQPTSPALRIAALRYLGILPHVVRYEVLHPHKSIVIRELGKVLDDPKRDVRKEAVDARTSWYICSPPIKETL